MPSAVIRKAEKKDLEAMRRIYNDEVLGGVSTFDIRPRTAEEWAVWYEAHNRGNHPLYVAETDGGIAGYGSLSVYRDRAAFDTTVELSVYVAPAARRQGIATLLMQQLIGEARRDGNTHLIVSVITSENTASIRLHEKFGFTYCGTLREVGFKMGRYRSVDYYTLTV